MKDGWLQNQSNRNILRFGNCQPNSSNMFIVCIDEIVKGQGIDFIIKEKETLKINDAVHLWRYRKLKVWKEMKTKK